MRRSRDSCLSKLIIINIYSHPSKYKNKKANVRISSILYSILFCPVQVQTVRRSSTIGHQTSKQVDQILYKNRPFPVSPPLRRTVLLIHKSPSRFNQLCHNGAYHTIPYRTIIYYIIFHYIYCL